MIRPITVSGIQCGPAIRRKEENLKINMKLIDEAAKEKPDFIVFSELSTTPYWCLPKYYEKCFEWAEPIPGPTTSRLAEKAKQYECYIIATLFEKGPIEGEYYNSALVIGPNGNIVRGELRSGQEVNCYRKVHIPHVRALTNERPYFKPGPGFPVFKTDKATIGILICYDRLFSEPWRILALRGAEIVFLSSCVLAWWKKEEKYTPLARTRGLENQLFIVACNKGGLEEFDGFKTMFAGKSCIVDPWGDIIKVGPENEGPAIISATTDLAEVSNARKFIQIYRDRRPDMYRPIIELV